VRLKREEVLDSLEHWPIVGFPGYSLRRTVRISDKEEFYGIRYAVCKRSCAAMKRSNRPDWGGPLRLDIYRKKNRTPRLSIRGLNSRKRARTNYCRVLGLALLFCLWDDNGRLRMHPLRVTSAMAENFEVHHLKKRVFSCQVKDLAVVSVALHSKLTAGIVKDLPIPVGGQPLQVPLSE
jgi:hypothetical protein